MLPQLKVLHTADLHLDYLFESFPPEKRTERRAELLTTFSQIVDIALAEEVAAVFISGDLFHTETPSRETIAAVTADLARLAQKRINCLIIPGNHDPLRPGSIYHWAAFPDNTYVFKSEEFEAYTQIADLVVYGLPFREEDKGKRVLSNFKKNDSEGFHVAMVHGSFKGLPFGEENYCPIYPEDIRDSHLDYVALGHYHNQKDCSEDIIKAAYPGTPDRLTFNELEQRSVQLVTFGMRGTERQSILLKTRPYKSISPSPAELQGDLSKLTLAIKNLADSTLCLRVIIKGLVEAGSEINTRLLTDQMKDLFYYLQIDDKTESLITEDLKAERSIRGSFVRKMEGLIKNPTLPEEERRVAKEALKLGLVALKSRRG
ncbi:MAG: metallophosphoesterase [bacterium]